MKILSRITKALTSFVELIPFYFKRKASVVDQFKNILVFGYGGLGDVVFMLPMLQGLRQWLPDANITIVTGSASGGRDLIQSEKVADEMKIVDWSSASLDERDRINTELMASPFDACLIPYTSPVRFFLPVLAKIPLRIGQVRKLTPAPHSWKDWFELNIWQEEFYRRRVSNRPVVVDVDGVPEHDLKKHLRMLAALGAPESVLSQEPVVSVTAAEESSATLHLREKGIVEGERLLGISVGVSRGMEWKIWDMAKMAQLAEKICMETASRLIFFGTASEQKYLDEFKKYFSLPIVDFVGQTQNLMSMAALIKKCQTFLSNDSGPSKLAMALGVPTTTIWGPSDRTGAGPWNAKGHVSVFNGISCSPCYRVGLTKRGPAALNHSNCVHHGCLTNLTVEEAFEKSDNTSHS